MKDGGTSAGIGWERDHQGTPQRLRRGDRFEFDPEMARRVVRYLKASVAYDLPITEADRTVIGHVAAKC